MGHKRRSSKKGSRKGNSSSSKEKSKKSSNRKSSKKIMDPAEAQNRIFAPQLYDDLMPKKADIYGKTVADYKKWYAPIRDMLLESEEMANRLKENSPLKKKTDSMKEVIDLESRAEARFVSIKEEIGDDYTYAVMANNGFHNEIMKEFLKMHCDKKFYRRDLYLENMKDYLGKMKDYHIHIEGVGNAKGPGFKQIFIHPKRRKSKSTEAEPKKIVVKRKVKKVYKKPESKTETKQEEQEYTPEQAKDAASNFSKSLEDLRAAYEENPKHFKNKEIKDQLLAVHTSLEKTLETAYDFLNENRLERENNLLRNKNTVQSQRIDIFESEYRNVKEFRKAVKVAKEKNLTLVQELEKANKLAMVLEDDPVTFPKWLDFQHMALEGSKIAHKSAKRVEGKLKEKYGNAHTFDGHIENIFAVQPIIDKQSEYFEGMMLAKKNAKKNKWKTYIRNGSIALSMGLIIGFFAGKGMKKNNYQQINNVKPRVESSVVYEAPTHTNVITITNYTTMNNQTQEMMPVVDKPTNDSEKYEIKPINDEWGVINVKEGHCLDYVLMHIYGTIRDKRKVIGYNTEKGTFRKYDKDGNPNINFLLAKQEFYVPLKNITSRTD